VAARGGIEAPVRLGAQGRALTVSRSAGGAGAGGARLPPAARFTFAELCERPLGAADYQELARSHGALFLAGVPQLTLARRNELRRFITLIDTLYEHHVQLVASADAPPAHTFLPTWAELADLRRGSGGEFVTADGLPASAAVDKSALDEAFAFDRTRSRLAEMQSEEYVVRAAWRPDISRAGTLDESAAA